MKTVVIEGENGDFTIVSHAGKNLTNMDSVDRIRYWQGQGSSAILNAAFEIIETYCLRKGIHPRIDRTVGFHSKTLSDKK